MNANFERWAEYNCIDSSTAMQSWQAVEPDLKDQGFEDFYRHTMEIYPALIFMQTHGLAIDHDNLAKTRQRVADEMTKLQELIDKEVGRPLNPLSPKQCINYFYGELGIKPYVNKQGRPTTDDKSLARIARRGIKVAKYIQQFRGHNKLHGTYLTAVIDEDGRLRSSFRPTGTVTGRPSSAQTLFGTGLNFYNLPAAFKSFIIPEPDHFMLEIDKRQAEWVVTAYASGDPKMIEAVESGKDVHAFTASLMTGASEELIKEEAKILGHSSDPDFIFQVREERLQELLAAARYLPRTMTCRQAGKKTNHGCNYYMGYRMFALTYEVSEAEAKLLVELYRSIYCNLLVWWDQIKNKLSKDRTLINCWGQKRVFLNEWNHDLVKAGIAFIPQSTVVYVLNDAIAHIYHDASDVMQPFRLGAHVYDSIMGQYPIGHWTSAAKAVMIMEQYANPTIHYNGRDFKIGTDLKMGMNWGDWNEEYNTAGMIEVPIGDNVTELADRMEDAYGKVTERLGQIVH